MKDKEKLKIPFKIQFRIYFSLLITLILFVSVYFALYYLGLLFGEWWGVSGSSFFGWTFVVLGFIPLIFSLSTKSEDRGNSVNRKEFPKLFKVIEEAQKEIGLKSPIEVYLLPTTEIFVTGLFKKKIGIGIATLRIISIENLRSILLHEFGHLYGKDTIMGYSLSRIEVSLERSSKFGKSWWDQIPLMEIAIIGLLITTFAKIYSFIFKIILSIYSRQIEYRADFIASKLSGEEEFGSALLNYSSYAIYFEELGYDYVIQLLQQGKSFLNLYSFLSSYYQKGKNKEILKIILEKDKDRFFSSHPSLKKRFKALNIKVPSLKLKTKKSAISLIGSKEKIEKNMSKTITNNIHVNLIYADALARQGKCRFCGEQCKTLQEFVEHEEKCDKKK